MSTLVSTWTKRALILPMFVVTACTDRADPELIERFRAACARLAAEASANGTQVVTGSDGWYFAAEEAAALGATSHESDAAVTELAVAAERLRKGGIELIVGPVPPKGIIYPDRLAPELRRADSGAATRPITAGRLRRSAGSRRSGRRSDRKVHSRPISSRRPALLPTGLPLVRRRLRRGGRDHRRGRP